MTEEVDNRDAFRTIFLRLLLLGGFMADSSATDPESTVSLRTGAFFGTETATRYEASRDLHILERLKVST